MFNKLGRLNRVVIAAGLMIALLIIGAIVYSLDYRFVHSGNYRNGDFLSFWLAGRMALHGEDPYQADLWIGYHDLFGSTWVSDPTFLYPLPLAYFLVPLGFFSLGAAYSLWMFLSQLAVACSLGLVISLWRHPRLRHMVIPVFAGAFLFRPTMLTLRNGQLGAMLLLILVGAVYLWEKGRWVSGAALFALLILKPQLGAPIIILGMIWLLACKRYNALAGIAVTLSALFLLGWIQNPSWLVEFLSTGHDKLIQTFGYSPTAWGAAHMVCGGRLPCTVAMGCLSSLILAGLVAQILVRGKDKLSPALALSLCVVAALLVTPYGWVYDQILLVLPISVLAMTFYEKKFPYLLSALTFLAISILSLILLWVAFGVQKDTWSVLIPLLCLGLTIWCARDRISGLTPSAL